MNITVECADAKVVAESLLIREKVAQKELQSLRDQIAVMERDSRNIQDGSPAGQGSIQDVSEVLHDGFPKQLVNTVDGQRQGQGQGKGQRVDNTEPLLLEIFRLTTSLDMKEETIQHLHQRLLDGRTGTGAGVVTGIGGGGGEGAGGGGVDQSPSSDVDRSPYKELFVNSEAEMIRLKVRGCGTYCLTLLTVLDPDLILSILPYSLGCVGIFAQSVLCFHSTPLYFISFCRIFLQGVVRSMRKSSKAKQSEAVAVGLDILNGGQTIGNMQEELLRLRRRQLSQESDAAAQCAALTRELNSANRALNQTRDELESLRGTRHGRDGESMQAVESHQLREMTSQLKAMRSQLEEQSTAAMVSE